MTTENQGSPPLSENTALSAQVEGQTDEEIAEAALQQFIKWFGVSQFTASEQKDLKGFILAALRAKSEKQQPLQLFMCEIPHLTLKENQTYIFQKAPECDECEWYLNSSKSEKPQSSGKKEAASDDVNAVLLNALSECPWPSDVWHTTIKEIGALLRGNKLSESDITAISGVLMRHGWQCAEKRVQEILSEHLESSPATSVPAKPTP